MATKTTNNNHSKSKGSNFAKVLQADVPHGRNGKHKDIVTDILDDLEMLDEGCAICIPLADLPASKEKIRAALSRACQQKAIKVVTSADTDHLYVWPATKAVVPKRRSIG
jgi:hypothetical protein